MARMRRKFADERNIRDRKNYGQYGSGFDASRRAAEDKYLNRLGGFSVDRGPGGNFIRYPGQDNQDLRYDVEHNIETSMPFGVWPQAVSRGIPSAGYQKYVGMMGDPEEKEKQNLILQGLEMQPEFSAYPLTTSDVGDIAFRTGDTGMYSTDAIEPYYGQPTQGTMGRANPFVQELTGTGGIPLYDVRTPQDIKFGYQGALPEDAQMTKPRQYIPNTMGVDRGPRSAMYKDPGSGRFLKMLEAIKNEFGGSAMAAGYGGSSLDTLTDEEKAELFGDAGVDTSDPSVPYEAPPPPDRYWFDPRGWFGFNRGGIASLRR